MTIGHEVLAAGQPGRDGFEIARMLRDLGAAGVRIADPPAVENFLLSHVVLASVIPAIIEEAMGLLQDVEVHLALDASPGPGGEYFVILLRQPEYAPGIVAIARRLTRQVLSQVPRHDWRVVVTTDFLLAS